MCVCGVGESVHPHTARLRLFHRSPSQGSCVRSSVPSRRPVLLVLQTVCTAAWLSAGLGCPCPRRLAARGTSPTEWPPGRAPRKVCAGAGDSRHRPAQRLQAVRFRPRRAGVQALSQHIGPSHPPGREVNTREAPGGCWMVAPSRALPVAGESRVRPTWLGASGPCGGADRPTMPS